MKVLLSCFVLSLFFFVSPEAQSNHHIKRGGMVQCCTPQLIAQGEQCDTSCRQGVDASANRIKNAGNVPCCDTPGLNPVHQCNMSCSYWDSNKRPARRTCTDYMRKQGRCR